MYENVIEVLDTYTGIDVMGEFYTTFLRFTKGNAKEKGIVLTPKHVTELFCDIAEFYSDRKFDENTKILDICCGTGAFLIASLNRIKQNIQSEVVSDEKKVSRYEDAQKNSLIGVERDASMYALAYANMRFHGDGKSNLFNCSSLLIDSYAPVDDSGKTYTDTGKIPLNEALSDFGDIDIGMINPPYSLDKKDNSSKQEYPIVKQINELKDKNKRLNKKIKEYRKKTDGKDYSEAIFNCQNLAIVPMSCAGNSGTKLRAELLKYHTLLACMTMPPQLFYDSHVGTATCIMVFKAHIPHDKNKATFFGRWQNDGFKVIPHNGRKDTGAWSSIREEWINQLDGTAAIDDTIWLRKKINPNDEALAEAYIETDYNKLDDSVFERTIKKYALYKYMDEKGLLGD